MSRKEVVIGASGVVLAVIALVAMVFVWTTVDRLADRADILEQRLTAIEDTVDTLGNKTDNLEQRLTATESTVDNLGDITDDLEQRLTAIENIVDSLGDTADDLEQRLTAAENKTWHNVGDFTLSPSKTSEVFNIQGEEWRLNFTFNQTIGGMVIGYNLRVYDANGNIVGGLGGIELADISDSGKGILNIREGHGDFTVETRGITTDFTFAFTVEEFY